MFRIPLALSVTACVAVAGVVAGTAAAAQIKLGTYRLHDHPDGNTQPPLYGMRLDGLFNVPGNSADRFTFSFDQPGTAMYLEYDGTSIRIHGTAFGGHDTSIAGSWDPNWVSYGRDRLHIPGVRIGRRRR